VPAIRATHKAAVLAQIILLSADVIRLQGPQKYYCERSHRRSNDSVPPSLALVSATNNPVVLIVEDEFLIRMAMAEAVRDAGFEVVEAGDAAGAIAILESRSDIQVVFTDIHMPGCMDGAMLAHTIRHRWPPVRVIATSGRVAVHKLDLPAGILVFTKPYNPEQIAWTLHALTAS
jgi:CheY-like chemotaxis protein